MLARLFPLNAQQHQVGHVHDDDEQPDDDTENSGDPIVRHAHGRPRTVKPLLRVPLSLTLFGIGVVTAILIDDVRGPTLDDVARRARLDAHVALGAGEVDEGGADERQHDAEGDLGAVEGGVELLAAGGARDDDAGRDADGAGDEAAQPRLHAPAQRALAHHLARDGADDAGRDAREQQRQREDGTRGRADARRQERVDPEDVGVQRVRVAVQRRPRHDQDRAVDEEREREERERRLGVRVLERVLDGRQAGHVVRLDAGLVLVQAAGRGWLALRGRHETARLVVVAQAALDDPRPQVQRVRHDGGAEDAARLQQALGLDHGVVGQVALEDLARRRVLDQRQLQAEADHDG